jgi:hypothetical protein
MGNKSIRFVPVSTLIKIKGGYFTWKSAISFYHFNEKWFCQHRFYFLFYHCKNTRRQTLWQYGIAETLTFQFIITSTKKIHL